MVIDALRHLGSAAPQAMLAKEVIVVGLKDAAGRRNGLGGSPGPKACRLRAQRAEQHLRRWGEWWLEWAAVDPLVCEMDELLSVAWDERVERYGEDAVFVSSVGTN